MCIYKNDVCFAQSWCSLVFTSQDACDVTNQAGFIIKPPTLLTTWLGFSRASWDPLTSDQKYTMTRPREWKSRPADSWLPQMLKVQQVRSPLGGGGSDGGIKKLICFFFFFHNCFLCVSTRFYCFCTLLIFWTLLRKKIHLPLFLEAELQNAEVTMKGFIQNDVKMFQHAFVPLKQKLHRHGSQCESGFFNQNVIYE